MYSRKQQQMHDWPFQREIHNSPVHSRDKKVVMKKAIPCHGASYNPQDLLCFVMSTPNIIYTNAAKMAISVVIRGKQLRFKL